MAVLKTIYTIDRIPSTAPARNTLGYKATTFEIVAASENEAIGKAQQASTYRADNFEWRLKGSRVVLVDEAKP